MEAPKCLACGEEMVPGGHGYMCFNGCDLEYRTIPPLGYCMLAQLPLACLLPKAIRKLK